MVKLPTEKEIIAQLDSVIDPEINISITDMGLIYGVEAKEINKKEVAIIVTMTLTTIGCPLYDVIANDIISNLRKLPNVTKVNIDLTFEPAWTPDMMSPTAKAELGWE